VVVLVVVDVLVGQFEERERKKRDTRILVDTSLSPRRRLLFYLSLALQRDTKVAFLDLFCCSLVSPKTHTYTHMQVTRCWVASCCC